MTNAAVVNKTQLTIGGAWSIENYFASILRLAASTPSVKTTTKAYSEA
jgi:hypothetical protein